MSDNDSAQPETESVHLPEKSVWLAYGMLIFGAFYGVHRIYIGKWRSGLLIAAAFMAWVAILDTPVESQVLISFEAGPLLVGDLGAYLWLAVLLVDGILLRKWVARYNEGVVAKFESDPESFLIEDAEHIAPWARGRVKETKFGVIKSYIGMLRTQTLFLLIPFATGYAASAYQSPELLMIPIVTLAAIGLIGTLDRTLSRHPTLMEIPGVGAALERVESMRMLYWHNEPSVWAAVKGLFLKARKEYRPYWAIASIVMATVVIEGITSYGENTAYIDFWIAASIVGQTAVFAAVVVLANLVPITAVSFHYSLSGKTTRLGLLTVIAITATIGGYQVSEKRQPEGDSTGNIPPYLDAVRLDERMKDFEYRAELQEKIHFFLNYYMDNERSGAEMGRRLADLLKSQAPNNESDAFGVISRQSWIGVVYHHDAGNCYTRGTDGMVSAWNGGLAEPIEFTPADQNGLIETGSEEPSDDSWRDESLASEDALVALDSTQYSFLAVAYKPTDEEETDEILWLLNQEENTPLDIIKYMDQKYAYYDWNDLLNSGNDHQIELFKQVIPTDCHGLINNLGELVEHTD